MTIEQLKEAIKSRNEGRASQQQGECTKPNCNCIEMEMKKQGTDLIKNYPCLKTPSGIDEVKREFRSTSRKWIEPKENIA